MWEIRWKINNLLLEILKYSAKKETAIASVMNNAETVTMRPATTTAVATRPRCRPLSFQLPAVN